MSVMNMRGWLMLVVVAAVALFAWGCGDSGGGAATQANVGPKQRPYKVVCTVAMVADIVRNVAGKHAQVDGLMGEGVDPHLYKPTRDDIAKLREADVVMYSGLLLEGKMTDTLVKIATSGKPVVAVTEKIDEKLLIHPDGAEGHPDPHVWMDPSMWSECVGVVAESLSAYDPTNAAEYRANAAVYQGELAKLAAYAKTALATVPEKSRVLITSHDAFRYFGRAYGVEVRGIQGISTESEAGLKDLEGLVKFIVDRDIRAVFVETSVAQKNVEALIEGAKARGKTISVGGTLFSDAMGVAGTYEGTYLGMIDHNVTIVTRALGGKAPEAGWQGKLTVTSGSHK